MSAPPGQLSLQKLVLDTQGAGGLSATLQALHDEELSRAVRLGTWTIDFGPLSRVITLWDDEPTQSEEDATGVDWLGDTRCTYQLYSRRLLRRELLTAPMIELRMYAPQPDRCQEFVAAMLAALPYRERYSPCAGVWTSRERGYDVVVHMWAYDHAEGRTAARRASLQDAGWVDYLTKAPKLVGHMQSFLLAPVPGRPPTQGSEVR